MATWGLGLKDGMGENEEDGGGEYVGMSVCWNVSMFFCGNFVG